MRPNRCETSVCIHAEFRTAEITHTMRLGLHYLSVLSLGVAVSAVPVQERRDVGLVERGAEFNNFLSILLSNIPVIDTTVTTGASVITEFDKVLAALTGAQTTYNELGGTCKKYTVIFARGTSEPGNVCASKPPDPKRDIDRFHTLRLVFWLALRCLMLWMISSVLHQSLCKE